MKFDTCHLVRILDDPNNPRKSFDDAKRQALVESIRRHGIKVPLIAYRQGEELILVDGHCRKAAAILAGLAEVPVVVLDKVPDAGELLLVQITINTHRTDFDAVDLAESYDTLMKLKKWNASQLAQQIGSSSGSVTRVLSVLKLAPEEQQLVREGKLTSSSGIYALARMEPEQRAGYVAKAANGEGVSRDLLNAKAKKRQPKKAKQSSVVCQLTGGTLTFASKSAVTWEGFLAALEDTLKEARKALKDSLDVTTFSRVLKDKSRKLA